MRLIVSMILVIVTMLAGDAVWLRSTMATLYQPAMGSLISPSVNFGAAVAFYLIYAFGLSYVVVGPIVSAAGPLDWPALVLRSAVFGLAAYGTYNLTGLSVIRDWPLNLSLIDMAWGTVLTTISACVAVLGLRLFRQLT